MTTGQFIVTFPYYGGWSKQRLRRAAHPHFAALAEHAGVTLTEDPSFRLDFTHTGVFLVVEAPATTDRQAAAVHQDAQQWAYQHQAACPHLSAWADQHLQEVAA